MTTLERFLTRHAVLTYFALTFAISWEAYSRCGDG